MAVVRYEKQESVGHIILDRPPANSYDKAFLDDLSLAIDEARFDSGAKAIVVRSASEKFFSAGADVKMFASTDAEFQFAFVIHANEIMSKFERTPKIVIAAINGHCLGGGLEIALCCDARIAAEGTYNIGLPEVTLGVLPGTGGTTRLAKMVGKSKAIELMVTGNTFSFEEALELGLVNQVIDATPEEWWEQVMDYARQFVPPNKASKAVGRIKRSVQSGWDLPLESALAVERELQQLLFQSDDAKEGIAANQEKRVPKFKGR
jgi:enoyl-CoA hydratase